MCADASLKERFHTILRQPCQCFKTENDSHIGGTNPQKLYSSSLMQTYPKSSSPLSGNSQQAVAPSQPGDPGGTALLKSNLVALFSVDKFGSTQVSSNIFAKLQK